MTDDELKSYEQELKTRMMVKEFVFSKEIGGISFGSLKITVMKLSDGAYLKWYIDDKNSRNFMVEIFRKYDEIITEKGEIIRKDDFEMLTSTTGSGEIIDYIQLDARAAIVNYKIIASHSLGRCYKVDPKNQAEYLVKYRFEKDLQKIDPGIEKLRNKIEQKERLIQYRKQKENEYLKGRTMNQLAEDERNYIESILDKIDFEITRFEI